MGVTFKGYNLDNYGVIFEKMPARKKPKRLSTESHVDGRDGVTSIEHGFSGYESGCTVVLTEPEYFDFLISLFDDVGVLIRNDEPTRYQLAKIKDEVEYVRIGSFLKASFNFVIEDPLLYLRNEIDVVRTASPSTFTNSGTYESLPLLKITGTGTVVLTINGTAFTYVFDTPYVYIDCKEENAYYLSVYKNRQMTGDFPRLSVGLNNISWTGSITELIITPRTRFL